MKTIILYMLLILPLGLINAQTALDFSPDAGLQQVQIPDITCPTEFTFEAWIYARDSDSSFKTILEFDNDSPYFGLYYDKLVLYDVIYSNTTIPINEWTHVAATFSTLNQEAKLYINGILDIIETNIDLDYIDLDGIGAGIGYNFNDNVFNGSIDDVRIWDTVRTGSEISANMNVCLTGTEANLYAFYNFNENMGTMVNDLTSNNFNASLLNMDPATDWIAYNNCTSSPNNSCEVTHFPDTYISFPEVYGQSFTAECEGILDYVQLFINPINTGTIPSNTLHIYQGNTITGTPIYSQNYPETTTVSGDNYFRVTLNQSLPVTQGNQYTFVLNMGTEVIPQGSDPSNDYIDGHAYFDGLAYTSSDCGFEVSITDTAFITSWQTIADGESITIPTFDGETYNYSVDWGDGTITTDLTGDANHTYANSGTYDVSIAGLFPRIHFASATQEQRDKIIDIKQWGNNSWTSMQRAFFGCSNLQISATDAPDLSNVSTLLFMLAFTSNFNQPINHWDVSNVTNMVALFGGASTFNQPLDNWDVSNVEYMNNMFSGASAFNQPLNDWDLSSVISISKMFNNTDTFNQPLNNWNVSNVTSMHGVFENALAFNQSLDDWDVNNVIDMSEMFFGASAFNQPLNSWDVSNVTDMTLIFAEAHAFNQSLYNWNVGSVTSMASMFRGAEAFNQPINNWDVSNVTNMFFMFLYTSSFNHSLATWDVSSVLQMDGMLSGSGMSTENYDSTLQAWATLSGLQNNVTLGANNLNYCNGETARNTLINNFGWIINDAGLDCSNLDVADELFLHIKLFPNPSKDYMSISNLNVEEYFVIYDTLGKKVVSGQLAPGSQISVAQLEKGIYFLKLENYKTLKFIKH